MRIRANPTPPKPVWIPPSNLANLPQPSLEDAQTALDRALEEVGEERQAEAEAEAVSEAESSSSDVGANWDEDLARARTRLGRLQRAGQEVTVDDIGVFLADFPQRNLEAIVARLSEELG